MDMSDDVQCKPEGESRTLQEKIAGLEYQLKSTKEALKVSQQRYEIAMRFSDVTVFDYDIKTKKILTQPEDFEIYGMQGVIKNGVDEVLDSGIIAERSKQSIYELYQKIDAGAPSASAVVYANALNGTERTLELQMITIFDQEGEPIYAVGVRKDITDAVSFEKEQKYGALLSSELILIYEVNVSQNRIFRYNRQWAKEIGLTEIKTFSELVRVMCTTHLAPEDVSLFSMYMSQEFILSAFQRGERIITFEYRKWVEGLGYQWFEARINLVEDAITEDVNMRVYIANIDQKKNDALEAEAERKRYELALAKSDIIYERNLTADTMRYVRKELKKDFDFFSGDHFTEEVLPLILNVTHPGDRSMVSELLSRTRIVQAYVSGQTNLDCEYRRMDRQGNYNWFRSSMQIFEDVKTKDLVCYSYIKDIDEEKKKELSLIYKSQHDFMTGFYNKHVAEEKITAILNSEDGSAGTHIFFMMDLDNFKLANDRFGHAFGDTVLSRSAEKISGLFRDGDVLGRVGGDEFVIFMRNVKNSKIALLKAQEICDSVCEVYKRKDKEFRVTASVGIAIYDRHGKNYNELYRHSDIALYDAKDRGRNRYVLYHERMQKK